MKRLIFLALMMVCSVSWAEWELCSTLGEGETSFYCDKSTIRKNGAISRMWVLVDYSSMQTDTDDRFMSTKDYWAFNCREETKAITSVIRYSGAMGGGNTVWSFTAKERDWNWEPIAPRTVIEVLWKIACGKK